MPDGWSENNVSVVGLTDGDSRLNKSKALQFMNMSSNNLGNLLGTNSNYAVFFKDKYGNILNMGGCMQNNAGIFVENITESICANFTVDSFQSLVSAERLLFYDGNFVKVVLYLWV